MRLYLILSTLLILGLSACEKEAATGESVKSLSFTGDWHLVEYRAFMPSVPNLQRGDVIWFFDSQAQTVAVQNSTNVSLDAGTYPYIVNSNNKTISIQVSGYTQIFDYDFSNGELVLSDSPEVDGPWMRFVR
jgi:hypothetical protein